MSSRCEAHEKICCIAFNWPTTQNALNNSRRRTEVMKVGLFYLIMSFLRSDGMQTNAWLLPLANYIVSHTKVTSQQYWTRSRHTRVPAVGVNLTRMYSAGWRIKIRSLVYLFLGLLGLEKALSLGTLSTSSQTPFARRRVMRCSSIISAGLM